MDMGNPPLKIMQETGWLFKEFKACVTTNYCIAAGSHDNETVIELLDKNLVIASKLSLPVSMLQFWNAQGDCMREKNVLDITEDGIAEIQKNYSKSEDQPLREGHVKTHFRMNTF